MSTTKIIKGRAKSLMGSYDFIEGPEVPPDGNPWKPATLIIGPGKVWTEEEVKKLVRDLREYLTETDFWQEDYDELLEGHGLAL